jgi:CPA2 family monovalent cation:H+ antiporter-2
MRVFANLLIILASSLVVIALFRRLQLPPVLGYLCVGSAVGPTALDWVNDSEELPDLAELGVVSCCFPGPGVLPDQDAQPAQRSVWPGQFAGIGLRVLLAALLMAWVWRRASPCCSERDWRCRPPPSSARS